MTCANNCTEQLDEVLDEGRGRIMEKGVRIFHLMLLMPSSIRFKIGEYGGRNLSQKHWSNNSSL
jgi:hypothetical protein